MQSNSLPNSSLERGKSAKINTETRTYNANTRHPRVTQISYPRYVHIKPCLASALPQNRIHALQVCAVSCWSPESKSASQS